MVDLTTILNGRRLLIFDFDGTIADTSPLHARAFSDVLAPHGIAVDYARIAGMKTADALAKAAKIAGRSIPPEAIPELVAQKQSVVRSMIAIGLQPLPGVDDFLLWAKSRFAVCLVTSGSRGTVALALDKLGYADLFDPIICADDIVAAKPDPDGFLTALRLTATLPAQALVFEDSDAGFDSARAAGLDYVDVRDNPWVALQGCTS